ncbi:MAG: TVP38/TMEM64 family protein [Bacilli bacterium]
MKKNITILALLFWVTLFFGLQYFGIVDLSIDSITSYIEEHEQYAHLLFTLFFTFRILLFIPSSVFLAAGALLFGPIEIMVISLISMFFTETAVYFIGRTFRDAPFLVKMKAKYPGVVSKLENNQKKFLFLLGAVPTAPTDVACLLVSSMGMRYVPYIIVVLLANTAYSSYYAIFGGLLKSLF